MSNKPLSAETIQTFRQDGVVVLRQIVDAPWRQRLAEAIAQNMISPGPYGKNHDEAGGVFFGDYVNWRRFGAYLEVAREGPLGQVAAQLMDAQTVQFFHEHVLVKEPGTSAETPWHQDMPYYCLSASKTVSIWIPLDPVDASVCPRFLAGSHADNATYTPRWFKTLKPLEGDTSRYQPFPQIDEKSQADQIRYWALEPGDAIAFDYHTVHNAPANRTTTRRRAVSLRFVGEDARFVERPHQMSPPFPEMGLDLPMGAKLPDDWFPTVWPTAQS